MTRIGNYAVEHELTTDGPLALLVATHAVLPRRALIKIVQPHAVGLRPVSVQLMREGCILEALHHPGVPRVFETGVTADRRPWVATELVPGETLATELHPSNFSIEEVVELIGDLAEVLAHAHARGVIHRNIRPAAIVRTVERAFPVCIVDWADARTLDSELPGEASDAPAYRAPELVQGEDPDGRADVFALGVIAYEAMTGQMPTMPISRRAPSAPARLALLVEQMLAADPGSRPTAAEACATARNIRMQLTLVPARGTRQQMPLGSSPGIALGSGPTSPTSVGSIGHIDETLPFVPEPAPEFSSRVERPLPDEAAVSASLRAKTIPDLTPVTDDEVEAAVAPLDDSDEEVVLLVPDPARDKPRWTPPWPLAERDAATPPTTIHPRRRSRIIREDK